MSTPRVRYVVERMGSEDRLDALKRTVLPKFDSPVTIVKYLETSAEVYLVLSKEIKGKLTNFILVTNIRKKLVDRVKHWEITCYFEHDSPPFYNCPSHFFEICPTTNPISLTWRERTLSIKDRKSNNLKANNQVYKLAESFEVGDTLDHPSYGELKIQHICMKEKAFWCYNHKHLGVRKYKLPLMSVEDWQRNLKAKQAKLIEECS